MRFFLKHEKFKIKKYCTIFESVLIKFFQIQYHPFIATLIRNRWTCYFEIPSSFVLDICCCDCCCIVSGIDQFCFGTHFACDPQGRELTQVFGNFQTGVLWLKRSFRCRKELFICSNIHYSF